MDRSFSVGQNSLEVAQIIVANHPEIRQIRLIAHKVGQNWRQRNSSTSSKVKKLLEGFSHDIPIKQITYNRGEFINLKLHKLQTLPENQVWSLISKVVCSNSTYKHIPMMNFHPENVGIDVIRQTIRYICLNKNGYILDSGRFFHYYGNFLLTCTEWVAFLAEFLMPCMVVSPRYIGHCLHDGQCTLRLTADDKYKPKFPKVIDIINSDIIN